MGGSHPVILRGHFCSVFDIAPAVLGTRGDGGDRPTYPLSPVLLSCYSILLLCCFSYFFSSHRGGDHNFLLALCF